MGSFRDLISAEPDSGEHCELELVYATLLHNICMRHLEYMLTLCSKQFKLTMRQDELKGTAGKLAEDFHEATQRSLRNYIKQAAGQLMAEGGGNREAELEKLSISETMKKRVLRIELINGRMAALLKESVVDEGEDKTKMDKTRNTSRSDADSVGSSCDTSSFASTSVVEKLWSESNDDEETSTPVELRRVSIVIAVARSFLKLLSESAPTEIAVGHLQQLQLDSSYLRRHISKMAIFSSSDEHQLNVAVDQFLNTTVNRCAQPKLLDPAMVKEICDVEMIKK